MTTSSPTVSSSLPPSSTISPQKQQQQQHQSSSLPAAAAPPVDILPTQVAQTYAHVHPTLLLAVYALRFRALVADPVSTLISDLPIFAALQVGYIVTCLPQAGSAHHRHPVAEAPGAAVAGGPEGGDGKRTVSSGGSSTGSPVVKGGRIPYRKKHGHGSKGDGLFGRLTVYPPPSHQHPPAVLNFVHSFGLFPTLLTFTDFY